jgi:hypothetical protein
MFAAAENLEFETAARLRDQLNRLHNGEKITDAPGPPDLPQTLSDKDAKQKSGVARKPASKSRRPRQAKEA